MGAIYNGVYNYVRNPYRRAGLLYGLPIGDPMPIKFARQYSNTGKVLYPMPSADLHLVADDLTIGSDWVSRLGGFVAARSNQPTVDVPTPYYPAGFSNATNRKAVSVFGAGPDKTYILPDDPSHEMTNTTTVTYLVAAKSGIGNKTEVIWSKYLLPDYNFIMEFNYSPFGYKIRAKVGFDITSAECLIDVPPYANTFFAVTFDGATGTLTLMTPYFTATSVGAGNIISNVGAGVYLGLNSNSVDPLDTGNIVEILRLEEVINQTQFNHYLYEFFGIRADTGQYPTGLAFSRGSAGEISINNQIHRFDVNIPRLNEYGVAVEDSLANEILDSDFTEPFISIWTPFIGIGGSGISLETADLNANKDIAGNAYKFTTDNVLTEAYIYQDTLNSYPLNTAMFLMASWAPLQQGARLNYAIKNNATGNYWDDASKTWVGATTWNAFPTSGTEKRDNFVFFTQDSMMSDFRIYLGNGGDAANALKDFSVYHVQVNAADKYCTHITNTGIAGSHSSETPVIYDSSGNIDFTTGSMEISLVPMHNSTSPMASDRYMFSADGNMMIQPGGTADMQMSDGTNTATLSDAYSVLEQLDYTLLWEGSVVMTIDNPSKGSIASSIMGPTIDTGANIFVGGNTVFNNRAQCFIKSVTIR